jgi:hypothetical protein
MPSTLARISWCRLAMAVLLVVAVLHEYNTPITAIRSAAEEWLIFLGKPAVLAAACWLVWSSIRRLRNATTSQREWCWLLVVAAAGLVKFVSTWRLHLSIDPLEELAVTLAFSISYIGTGGRGWEWALPPLPHRIAWYAVWLSVFGVECMVAGKGALWIARHVLPGGKPE